MKETVYYIKIEFNNETLSEEGLTQLLEEEVAQKDILEIDGYTVKIAWRVPYEGIGELQNELYYLLDGGRYGVCVQYELK